MVSEKVKWMGNICPTANRDNPNQGRVYNIHGISRTLTNMSGGNLQPMIVVEVENDKTNNSCQPWQKSSESV